MSSSPSENNPIEQDSKTIAERNFLHDLSNHLAIVQGQLQILNKKIQKNPTEIKAEDVSKSIDSALGAVVKAVAILKERRDLLRAQI